MATKRIVNLPNVSGWIGGVGGYAAHTITIDCPVGPRYHEIWLEMNSGATVVGMAAAMGEIRVKVNGKVQRTHTAAELNFLNTLNGLQYIANGFNSVSNVCCLPIYFAEPWRENEDAQDGLAWATGDVSTFQIEIDMAVAAASAGLTKPVARAVIDNSLVKNGNALVDAPMGAIVKVGVVQIPVASGFNDFAGLPKRDFYQSIHVIDANLTEFEVKVDNNIIRQGTTNYNRAWLRAHGMLPSPTATVTPINVAADLAARTTYTDIVFDHDDRIGSSLPMNFNGKPVGDFNLRLNTTTTGNVKCLYQRIGAPD